MMTHQITESEAQQLPYVKIVPSDGRIVPLVTFYDTGTKEWFFHAPHDGSIIRIQDGEVISGSYLANATANPRTDFVFPLGTFVVQHLSFEDILDILAKIENDVHRCAAVLEKYEVLWRKRRELGESASLLIESELEYLIFLLRSLYDLLQGLIRRLGSRFVRLDDRSVRAMSSLSPRFSDIVVKNDEIVELSDLVSRYRMPEQLARWYHMEAPFFRELRDLRNGIAHRGRRLPSIYKTEWGFAVSPSEAPWSKFKVWSPEQLYQGRLGSVRGLFVSFIAHSLDALTRFVVTIRPLLELPAALGDDRQQVFLRSPFGHQLVGLDSVLNQPWEERDDCDGQSDQ